MRSCRPRRWASRPSWDERLVHQGVAEGEQRARGVAGRLDDQAGARPGRRCRPATSAGAVPLARASRRASKRSPMAAAHSTSSRSAGASRRGAGPDRLGQGPGQLHRARAPPPPASSRSSQPGLDDGAAPAPRARTGCRPTGEAARPGRRAPAAARGSPSSIAAASSGASGPRASSSARRSRRSSARSAVEGRAARRRPPAGRSAAGATGPPRSARARNGISERLVASAQCRSSSTTSRPRAPGEGAQVARGRLEGGAQVAALDRARARARAGPGRGSRPPAGRASGRLDVGAPGGPHEVAEDAQRLGQSEDGRGPRQRPAAPRGRARPLHAARRVLPIPASPDEGHRPAAVRRDQAGEDALGRAAAVDRPGEERGVRGRGHAPPGSVDQVARRDGGLGGDRIGPSASQHASEGLAGDAGPRPAAHARSAIRRAFRATRIAIGPESSATRSQ